MSLTIDMQPGHHDQPDLVVVAVRWWMQQLGSFFPRRPPVELSVDAVESAEASLPADVCIVLSRKDAFVAPLTLPRGPPGAHRSAIGLRLSDLAPLEPALLEITAVAVHQHMDRRIDYAVCMARSSRMEELAAEARRKGARRVMFRPLDCESSAMLSRTDRAKQRILTFLHAGLACLVVLLAATASIAWTSRIEGEVVRIVETERTLRRTVGRMESGRLETAAADDLVVRELLDRRAGVVLKSLADASAATPDSTWWTRIVWTPEDVSIRGLSADAVAAIAAMSDAALGWNVAMAGPVSTAPDTSPQSFDVRLSRRDGPGG